MKKLLLKTYFLLFLFAIFLPLNACVSRVEKHGYMFDLADYELLEEGISSKDRVLRIMGSPTLVSDFDGKESWIYYAEDVRNLLFFKPDVVNRKLILLEFDDEQIISKMQNYDLNNDKNIKFSSDYTKVKSNKIGFFKSIFGNIGQVRPQ